MNTPHPCDTCKHCGWDCFTDDDPSDSAYCKLGWSMGNPICSFYERDPICPKLEIPGPVSAYGAPAFIPNFHEREAAIERPFTEEEIRKMLDEVLGRGEK